MNTFNEFCNEKEIEHFREAFYHHCMAAGLTQPTREELEREWSVFLAQAVESIIAGKRP